MVDLADGSYLETSLDCYVVGRHKGESSMGWVNGDDHKQRNRIDLFLVGACSWNRSKKFSWISAKRRDQEISSL